MHSGYAHICVSVCVFVIISLFLLHVGRHSLFWFLCASRLWVRQRQLFAGIVS